MLGEDYSSEAFTKMHSKQFHHSSRCELSRVATFFDSENLPRILLPCVQHKLICFRYFSYQISKPQELIPLHPVYNVQDWDDPPGAIDWPRFRNFLKEVKETGVIPDSHKSHDHLNEQKDIPVTSESYLRWKDTFHNLISEHEKKGEKLTFGLVDGFLLYWDEVSGFWDVAGAKLTIIKAAVASYDVRIFLRVSHDVLRKRRHERHGYHTAGEWLRLLRDSDWKAH